MEIFRGKAYSSYFWLCCYSGWWNSAGQWRLGACAGMRRDINLSTCLLGTYRWPGSGGRGGEWVSEAVGPFLSTHIWKNWGDKTKSSWKIKHPLEGERQTDRVQALPLVTSETKEKLSRSLLWIQAMCYLFNFQHHRHTNRDRCQERKGGKGFRCSWNKYNTWLMREKVGNQRTWENRQIRNYGKRGREGGSEDESVKGTFQLDLRSRNPCRSLVLCHNACVMHLTASLTLYCHMSL